MIESASVNERAQPVVFSISEHEDDTARGVR